MNLGTTNDEKPFEIGELITFAGETYEVTENNGNSGYVRYPEDSQEIKFYWFFEGEHCRRLPSE